MSRESKSFEEKINDVIKFRGFKINHVRTLKNIKFMNISHKSEKSGSYTCRFERRTDEPSKKDRFYIVFSETVPKVVEFEFNLKTKIKKDGNEVELDLGRYELTEDNYKKFLNNFLHISYDLYNDYQD